MGSRFGLEYRKDYQIHAQLGVRQGCSLSPLLYLIYDEAMVKEAFHNAEHGITVVDK